MLFLFVSILLFYFAINLYIGWHGSYMLTYLEVPYATWINWVLFAVLAFAYLIGRLRLLPGPLNRLLKVMGSYYFAVMEFALVLLPFADVAAWLLHLSGMKAESYVPLIGWVVILLLAAALVRGSWNAWNPIIRTYEVNIDKKAGSLEQLRIAVASDLHLGNIVGNRHLGRMVKEMNALAPDLILLPGDVIDDDIEPFIRNRMSEVMQQLHAKFGIYAVLGNHEYYGGHAEEHVKQMAAIGIRVLKDETVLINDSFYIAGRKDKTAESADPEGRLSVANLLTDLDLKRPVLLMDHQPYQFDKAAEAGADILFCGHTHRGQFAPNHWVTRRIFELDWGYLLKRNMHVIVSSGFGTWGPPIRIASRSEIIEVVVRFKG